jgi:ribonuclease BN (tRNA processing enzyme)
MTDTIWQAFAQANNDLTLDNGYRDFTALAQVTEIGGAAAGDIPLVFAPGTFVDPNTTPCPAIDPVLIYGPDGNGVAVWATLNDHRQVYPSFAFRFDTPDGSVIFSGDTGADTNGNLQKLASVGGQADFLVHEVIDTAWVNYRFGNSPPVGSRNYVLRRHMLHSHTPIEDVGTVAESCGVRTLVLNHIVPGMIPTSHLLQAQQGFSGRLVIGEDLMQIGVV